MAAPVKTPNATEARLAAMSLLSGDWTSDARQDALARTRAMGLPGRRDEYWRFTAPDLLTDSEVPQAAVFETGEPPIFDEIDSLKIVFLSLIHI